MDYFSLLPIECCENIFYNCDKDSLLLIATVCINFNNILSIKNENLILSTKYITSSLSLCLYAHGYFKHDFNCINNIEPNFSIYGYRQCSTAAKIGCHLCLAYSHNMGCSWDTNTSALSSENNNIKCLKYCMKYGCKINEMTSYWASCNGNLDILIFCNDNGVKWNSNTCMLLAGQGHLKCLKYVRSHGCPWRKHRCIELAIQNKHHYIADWINEN
jgi:hypothetical protein